MSTPFNEHWLEMGACVPVDIETTAAFVAEIHRLIDVIGGMALAQPEERNFCPRCGKRTTDLTTIHTCTPPQIDPNQWAFDNGLEST